MDTPPTTPLQGLAGQVWRILNKPIIDMLIGTQPRDCDDDEIHKRWSHSGMPCPACLATLQVKAKPLARPNIEVSDLQKHLAASATPAQAPSTKSDTTNKDTFMNPIPVISANDSYPLFLTDRFGEWTWSPKSPEIVKELGNKFLDAFGNDPGTALKPGDPRALMGGNETSFLVVKDGRFGVLSEIELSFAEEPDAPETGHRISEWVNAEEFATRVQEWSRQLTELAPNYPASEFFLAHGAPTYDGRLTLNAFTPVEVGWGCVCTDPYRAQGKSLERLDEAMSALAYAAPCALEYSRTAIDGDVATGLETSARIYVGSASPRIITEHFLDGEIASGDVTPTGAVYGNTRYNVACNGDEITAIGEGGPIDSHAASDRPQPLNEVRHAPR